MEVWKTYCWCESSVNLFAFSPFLVSLVLFSLLRVVSLLISFWFVYSIPWNTYIVLCIVYFRYGYMYTYIEHAIEIVSARIVMIRILCRHYRSLARCSGEMLFGLSSVPMSMCMYRCCCRCKCWHERSAQEARLWYQRMRWMIIH